MTGPNRLLDSDTRTLFRHGHAIVTGRVLAYPAAHVFASAVNLEEAISGWYTFLRQARRVEQVEQAYDQLVRTVQFFSRLPILPYDRRAIAEYERIRRLKLNVRASDLKIAATAKVHRAKVVTRNLRGFQRVPGLDCEDWSDDRTDPLAGPPPAA